MHEIEGADSDGERPHPITIAPHDQRESGVADDSVSSARCWTAAERHTMWSASLI